MSDRIDPARRGFLRRLVSAERPAPVNAAPTWDDYFSSYALACAQVNEAKPFLLDDARRLGIDTEGLSDVEILKAVFATTGRPGGRPDDKEA